MRLLRCLFLSTVLLLTACTFEPAVVASEHRYSAKGENSIYVVNHGWHTGIVVPSEYVFARIPELTKRFANTEYMEFGWGDKGFYQADEITSGLTLKALFLSTESVVHVVGMTADVNEHFPYSEVKQIVVSQQELTLLVDFIAGSFAYNQSGLLAPGQSGIYGNSQFYQGKGEYHLFNTCNKWTAKGLKSIGMDISVTLKLTSKSIMDYLQQTTQNG